MAEMQKKTNKQIVFEYMEKIDTLEPKYGLDSNIIIYLIAKPELYKKQSFKIFNHKGLFFIHEKSLKEIHHVLVRDYEFKKNGVSKKVKDFLKEKNISILATKKELKSLVIQRMNICLRQKIWIHPPDIDVISDFKEYGINKVFSEDGTFIRACIYLRLNAVQIWFKFKKKKKKK